MRWAPGDTVVERGVFFGTTFFARPHRVVSHEGDVLATYLPIGTKYHGALSHSRETAYEELARGEMTFGERTWVEHSVLTLVRPGDPYSIMGFWSEEGRFVGWYANLQDPLRWTDIGYDTRDHALDVIIGEDLNSWMLKDEDELAMSVQMGLYTPEEGREIERAGQAVIEMVKAGEAWWGDWRAFEADPTWPIPVFPEGWESVSTP